MPHRQSHRGPHPDDARLFGAPALPRLRRAAAEVVWLLDRGYPQAATVDWVGGHHQLEARQRMALRRALCAAADGQARRARARSRAEVAGARVAIDGFNLVITVEVALSGGLLLDGSDGALRDLAGLRGSYHPVEETERALGLVGEMLGALAPAGARILLDAPVSNSGRLRARILEHALAWPFAVEVELAPDVDRRLATAANVVSSDSAILDACQSWLDLGGWIVDDRVPDAWRLRLLE
jgi:hypothetical protein